MSLSATFLISLIRRRLRSALLNLGLSRLLLVHIQRALVLAAELSPLALLKLFAYYPRVSLIRLFPRNLSPLQLHSPRGWDISREKMVMPQCSWSPKGKNKQLS